jgi:hypothetical protein
MQYLDQRSDRDTKLSLNVENQDPLTKQQQSEYT